MSRPLPPDGIVGAVMRYGRATATHALASREFGQVITEYPYGSEERRQAAENLSAAEAEIVDALGEFSEALHHHGD